MTVDLGTREAPIPNPPISIETVPDGSVLITLRIGTDTLHPETVVFALGAPEAIEFAGRYANAVAYATADALREAAAGRCETCANHRLVTVEQHGRPVQVECPTCRGRAGQWNLWRDRLTDAVPEMAATYRAVRGDRPWTVES